MSFHKIRGVFDPLPRTHYYKASKDATQHFSLMFHVICNNVFFGIPQITYDFSFIFPKVGEDVDFNQERYCGAKVGVSGL